jgi:hypothetical protein
MTDRDFRVPTDLEILEVMGAEPEQEADEPTTRVVDVAAGTGGRVVLSYDILGRSVRCRWQRGSEVVLDLFREGATLLRAESRDGADYFVVDFETDAFAGQLIVRVHPDVSVNDSLLLR